jgi:hypothetical protein
MERCRYCRGRGYVIFGARYRGCTCECVYRRVFRVCNQRYYELRMRGEWNPSVHGLSVGIKQVEYMADFELVAARALERHPREWDVFVCHHLHRLPWTACGRLVRLDRGTFFHAVYRVEVAVGRASIETLPYGVWPADYFSEREGGRYGVRMLWDTAVPAAGGEANRSVRLQLRG